MRQEYDLVIVGGSAGQVAAPAVAIDVQIKNENL